MFWPLTSDGEFTVKSGTLFACFSAMKKDKRGLAGCSGDFDGSCGRIWEPQVVRKVKTYESFIGGRVRRLYRSVLIWLRVLRWMLIVPCVERHMRMRLLSICS